MKLSALISFHYIVFAGLTILVSTAKLVSPLMAGKPVQIEVVKKDVIAGNHSERLLHSELLFKY
jgi:hypothetical protein